MIIKLLEDSKTFFHNFPSSRRRISSSPRDSLIQSQQSKQFSQVNGVYESIEIVN